MPRHMPHIPSKAPKGSVQIGYVNAVGSRGSLPVFISRPATNSSVTSDKLIPLEASVNEGLKEELSHRTA